MSDTSLIQCVHNSIAKDGGKLALLSKNGRLLLAIPEQKEAAMKALSLYQPQRLVAKAYMGLAKAAMLAGVHHRIFPKQLVSAENLDLHPEFPPVCGGTCGILLGSPEHKVRRAIACYRTATGWEVAKAAFGPEGWDVFGGEAATLNSLPPKTAGAPESLGTHRGKDISLMRMPYISGRVLKLGETEEAIAILEAWISKNQQTKPLVEFAEWSMIRSALSEHPKAESIISRFAELQLTPAVRHGDFARWNLLRGIGGKLVVLDWEWGVPNGMPGLDLVHYFAQDARLVQRLKANEVVDAVHRSLHKPSCVDYLKKSGWGTDVASAIVASIAFTVGAKQQANEEVLEAALHAWHHANHR